MTSSRTRQAPALLLVTATLVAVLLSVATSASADPSIAAKRAQAEAIVAQIREMDSDLSQAIEAYNYANVELGRLDSELESNGRHLVVAQDSLKSAQANVAARLRALYINGDGGGAVEVILGAQSLDDLLDRVDVAERVGARDALVVREVRSFRQEVKTRRGKLRDDRASQARVVGEREQRRESIEAALAERERLYASVKDEIAQLEAEERRRQERLAAQARARVAAQQAALRSARQQALVTSESESVIELDPYSSATSLSAPAPPSKYGGVVGLAMQYLGVPYVWGGMSPSGFDCSGLTSYVYAQVGVSLPHHAASQFGVGFPVAREELQAGDLVFFDGLGHMGMYVGGDQFIHAPHTGDVVKISSLNDSWYASKFVGARRVV